MEGYSFSWRIGAQYDLSDTLTFGIAYADGTDLVLEGGTGTLNLESAGLGRADFDDAQISGLALPKEASAGIAWQFRPNWTLGFDINWYEWSEAFGEVSFELSGLDNQEQSAAVALLSGGDPAVETRVAQTDDLAFRDTWVMSAGLIWQRKDNETWMFGANHQTRLQRSSGLALVNNLLGRNHLGLGLQKQLSEKWQLSLVASHALEETQKYQETRYPLGTQSEERFSAQVFQAQFSYAW